MRNSNGLKITLAVMLVLACAALLAPGIGGAGRAQQKKQRGRPEAKPPERQLVRPPVKGAAQTGPAQEAKAADEAPPTAAGQRRVALVIGNGNYSKFPPLPNPVNDAQLVGETLRELGFEVLQRENVSRREMLEAIQTFSGQISSGGVGLFYYAGHGVQVSGLNYLVPTDLGKLASLQDVKNEMLSAGEVLEMMSARRGLNIVILDACRNNPVAMDFPSAVSQGLAAIKNTPAGTLIAFSTSPGATASDGEGRNSPYAAALVQSLRMRPSRLEDVFIHTRLEIDRTTGGRQTPWENSSLKTVFFFRPDEVAATPLPDLSFTGSLRGQLLSGLLGGLRQFEYAVPVTGNGGRATAQKRGRARLYVEDAGGVELEMVEVGGGRFAMGSNAAEADAAYADAKRYNDQATRDTVAAEMPVHSVNVPGFYIGKYEVTQRQWQAVMGRLPRLEEKYRGDDLPVVNVTWREVEEFCRRLSKITGRQYRLPSEAEWEYACRAGTDTPYAFGPTINHQLSNFNGAAPFGGAERGTFRQSLTPVGEMGAANAFGLFDMHGNAWEWCADNWHDSYDGAPTDGSVWDTTDADNRSYRVIRGGSWDSIANSCRSASRRKAGVIAATSKIGFRVVAG